MFLDRAAVQDALELFATFPTGHPTGAAGFSSGMPSYLLGFSIAWALTPRLGLSNTDNVSLQNAPSVLGPGAVVQVVSAVVDA